MTKNPNNIDTNSPSDNTANSKPKTRKYLTLLDGQRKWVILVPPKSRGKDVKPRKRGEEHGNWKHGFGKSRPYDTKKYGAWKEAVLKRGSYRCLITGQTNNLTCHHLNSWDWCEEGRYDVSNGVVIFEEIHKPFHSLYQQGNNTRAQFEHFLCTCYNKIFLKEQKGNHEPSLTIETVIKELEVKNKKKTRCFN